MFNTFFFIFNSVEVVDETIAGLVVDSLIDHVLAMRSVRGDWYDVAI
jgi:hypothetical protein